MKINPSYLLIILLLSCCISMAQAQQDKEDIKAIRKELSDQAIKDARKEAESIEKAGWYTQPGTVPLEKQVERAWMKEVETDDVGVSKYFTGTGSSLASTQSAAQVQANSIAKRDLARQINSEITSIIEEKISAEEISATDAAMIQSTVSTSTDAIFQKLARVITLTEIYKKQGENFECQMRIAYNQRLAKETAKQVLKESLQEKSNLPQEQLDMLMNF